MPARGKRTEHEQPGTHGSRRRTNPEVCKRSARQMGERQPRVRPARESPCKLASPKTVCADTDAP
eukprot:8054473-Alexandrium_andersonii.AAC.1